MSDIRRDIDTISENAYLKLISRISMTVGIPFGLWVMYANYDKLESLTEFQIETKIIVEQLQQRDDARTLEATGLSARVRDLEEAMRSLERAVNRGQLPSVPPG